MPFDKTQTNECSKLAKLWHDETPSFNKNAYFDFTPSQKMVFLEKLMEYPDLTLDCICNLDKYYDLSNTFNCEIKFRWQMLCLKFKYEPIYPSVVQFVSQQGRMKYVRPLYRLLNQVDHELAVDCFLKHRSFYHPIAERMIAQDIL